VSIQPRGLLLDFGGVIAESRPVDRTAPELLDLLADLTGGALARDMLEADFLAGRRAYAQWRDALARTYAPVELTHEQFWGDFVAADWSVAAREAVVAQAAELTYLWVDRGERWSLRAGVVDLLDLARQAGIGVAVVSNSLCGAAFRAFLERSGVTDRFALQIYSDEAGIRKPNPAMAQMAAAALGVPLAQTWFVGDQVRRDVLCARRAGVGRVILVPDPFGREQPTDPRCAPDDTVASMVEVHQLLVGAVGPVA
jgi:HAD superfamily hydrolase (TIGR01549 family)